MTQREPQNDDFMTVDANRRRLHLREVAGSAAGRYDGIGGELRAARMRNRLDLEAIGVKLRINAAYLLAIEEGRFTDLPGHVYVYGFLRSYAQYLGLDAEAVIRQYKTEAANPKPTAKLDFPSPMDRGRLPTLRILLISVVLAGLVYGGWSMLTEENRQTAERVAPLPDRFASLAGISSAAPSPAPPPPVAAAPEPAPAPPAPGAAAAEPARPATAPPAEPAPAAATPPALPALVAVTPVTPLLAPAPVATALAPAAPPPQPVSPAAPVPAGALPAVTPPVNAPPAATASTPAFAGDDPRRRAGEGSLSVNGNAAPAPVALPGQEGVARRLGTVTERPGLSAVIPATPPPASQSFGATAEPSRITVRADIDSWVQVTTTGGQPVFARMLRAGDRYLVPNRPGLRLMTGNGGGLRITVDGSPTPSIGTLGAVVRDVALDPERLLRGNATANETPGG